MTAQDAIDYANELLRHNAEVNGSYYSNPGVAMAAGVASKLLDVATQLQALQTPPVVSEPVVEEKQADAEPS